MESRRHLPVLSLHGRRVIKFAEIGAVANVPAGSGGHGELIFLFLHSVSFDLFPLFLSLFVFIRFLGLGGGWRRFVEKEIALFEEFVCV